MDILADSRSVTLTINGIELIIDADYDQSAGKSTLCIIDSQTALDNDEAQIQLLEGASYNYELPVHYQLGEVSKVVRQNHRAPNRGRITPGNYVGRLPLVLIDPNGKEIPFALEIRSIKTEYRSEYRRMLEDITDECTDLLMMHSSPITQRYNIDYESDTKSLYQKFSFVKSVVGSEQFQNAVQRVVSMPVTSWSHRTEEHDIRRIRKVGSKQLRQLASRADRIRLPSSHSLYNKMETVPSRITSEIKIDTVDTPENRFVKHALTEFQQFCGRVCQTIEKKLPNKEKRPYIYHEAIELEKSLSSSLHHDLFSEVSSPTSLPLNSPVLQRKEGYREILRTWLMFDLAAKLTWEALDDSYNAGKRDVATLYEYWLFFKLLRMLEKMFKLNAKDIEKLIQPTKDGLGLQLQAGKHTAIEGTYSHNGRDLNVKFNFNRTFSKTDYPSSGSWTQSMRPDYTLSVWPHVYDEDEAEEQELIIHIHFDAKYKIEGLQYIIDEEEVNIDEEKDAEKNGTYKRADLLKMHAYKDAIRRTAGAYVLYPGTNKQQPYKGFHEIVPGLGAFPISPSKESEGIDNLQLFVEEVIDHFSNRASQREQLSYHSYGIHNHSAQILKEAMPEYLSLDKNKNKIRIVPPTDSTVLVGYYNEDQFEWIEDNKLYNIRIDPKDGLVDYGNNIMGAKYLLLHGKGEVETSRIWEIRRAPRLISKDDLVTQKNYPRTPSSDNYFIFELKRIDNDLFNGKKWDLAMLLQAKTVRQSSRPFAMTLSELFSVANQVKQ